MPEIMRLILSALYNTLASWQRNTFGDVITHSVPHCKSNNHPFNHSDTCTISKYFPKTHCSIFSAGQRAIHSKAGWGRGEGGVWLVLINDAPATEWRGIAHSKPLDHISSSSAKQRSQTRWLAYRRRRRFVRYSCNTHDSSKLQREFAFTKVNGVTFQKTAVCISSTDVTVLRITGGGGVNGFRPRIAHLRFWFLGAFAKLRNANTSFVMSVCPSACKNSAPTRWIFMKSYTWAFFENMLRNFMFS